MLILTRRPSEGIYIGTNSFIKLLRTSSGDGSILLQIQVGSDTNKQTVRTCGTVTLPNGTSIHLLDVRGNQARLGFEAPRTVSIVREELLVSDQKAAS